MNHYASDVVTKSSRFREWDYVMFGGMLIASAVTGIYFGYFKRKKVNEEDKTENVAFGSKSLTDYLLGSRELTVFPVAMSLIASFVSGVTILGNPTEVYNYGILYEVIVIPIAVNTFIVTFVFLPVFFELKVPSTYEVRSLNFQVRKLYLHIKASIPVL